MDVFRCYPEICALGQRRLQELCDEWVSTPVAKEFMVGAVRVGADLRIKCDVAVSHSVENGEIFHFPVDDLLRFVTINGLEGAELRAKVLGEISARRKTAGPRAYQRFRLKAQPLFVTCKNPTCDNVMQHNVPVGSRMTNLPVRAQCPRCEQIYEYHEQDFRLEP